MRVLLKTLSGLWLTVVMSPSLVAQTGNALVELDSARASTALGNGLRMVLDTTARTVDPGASFTVRVIVENNNRAERTVAFRSVLPPGWRTLSGSIEEHIAGNGRAMRLVQYAIPGDAMAGEYRVVQVASSATLEEDLRAELTIVVRPRRSLTVVLVDEPYFASSSSTYKATFLVANRGNVRTRVRLHTESERNYATTFDTLTELAPGESRSVNVVVNTGRAAATEALRHHVTLVAEPDGGLSGDEPQSPRAVASVRVIPRGNTAAAPSYNIPLHLKLSSQTLQLGAANSSTSQSFEVSGSGPLTEGGSSILELFARSAEPVQSLFAQRDEYRVGLAGPRYNVQLGDHYFALTPLSEPGLIATGVSGRRDLGHWSAGGFVGRDRLVPGSPLQHSGFVGLSATSRLHMSVNASDGGTYERGALATLHGRFRLTRTSTVEAERGMRLDGSASSATMLHVFGQHGWLNFDVRHQHADSSYPGSIRGSRENWVSASATPFFRFRISGRLEDRTRLAMYRPFAFGTFQSASLTTMQTLMQATLQERQQAPTPSSVQEAMLSTTRSARSAVLSADFANVVSAGIRTYQNREVFANSFALAAPSGERAAWVRLGKKFNRITLATTAEWGLSDHLDGGNSHPFNSIRYQAGVRPTLHQSFSAFLEHSSGERGYMTKSENAISTGGNVQLRMGRLSLAVEGAMNPAPWSRGVQDSTRSQSSWLDGSAAFNWSGGRALTLRVRGVSSGFGLPASTTARISYSRPLRMPAGRSKSVSRVMGKVYDAETGRGVANALVRLGDQSALTDDEGRVAFEGVRPNRYRVLLDLGAQQTAGVGLETDATEVAARAGRTSMLSLRVVHLGRIRGKLQLFELVDAPRAATDSQRVRKSNGLAGVTVWLINGTEERRAVSDESGWFELRDARPGTWHVIVPSAQLPAQYHVEGDSVRLVELSVGASQIVEINVMPRQRKILPLDAVPAFKRPPSVSAIDSAIPLPPSTPPIVPQAPVAQPTQVQSARLQSPHPPIRRAQPTRRKSMSVGSRATIVTQKPKATTPSRTAKATPVTPAQSSTSLTRQLQILRIIRQYVGRYLQVFLMPGWSGMRSPP